MRAAVRAVVLGIFVYLATVLASGHEVFDIEPFLWGLGLAAVRAALGYLTPLEPLIGVQTRVEVPSPPAVLDPDQEEV